MEAKLSSAQQHIDTLSRLLFHGYSENFCTPNENLEAIYPDLEYITGLSHAGRSELLRLAHMHHVSVRALQLLEKSATTPRNGAMHDWCHSALSKERSRINHAVKSLAPVCDALAAGGAEVTVIKSLDHWPDLGSDLDLYTTADRHHVVHIMSKTLGAKVEPRSWGDRLANKWNFSVPGLPELVEIHIRYLGQTGEHTVMARRVGERSVTKTLNGYSFRVAAPEEQVVISTLQRMYRHFYFRLCDMADAALWLQNRAIDFVELKNAAKLGGIWPGVASFLLLVSEYAKSFSGKAPVPDQVLKSAPSADIRVHLGANFLRVPRTSAARLYTSQLISAGRQVNLRAMTRLPLLPPLAVSALIAYKLTGSDKGIW
jgi:hypothetical protein